MRNHGYLYEILKIVEGGVSELEMKNLYVYFTVFSFLLMIVCL